MNGKSSGRKKNKMIHIWLPDDLHRKLKIKVAEERSKMQDWVHRLIEKELSDRTEERKNG
ncbi:hypothetical protein JXQ70_06695 [bacterium]|nr:hypothetical protein [bacterium]